jgi:signal transduction histidine kinase/DNA-binding response OmpR family regulator
MMKWRFLFPLLLLCQLAFSQQREINSYTTLNGLNNGTINDIVQDSLGRLWLSTPDGLMHFDGYQARNFVPVEGDSTSLPARRAIKLFMDSKNSLWVSTISGVCRYDDQKNSFVRYTIEGADGQTRLRYRMNEHNDHLMIRFGVNIYCLDVDDKSKVFRPMSIINSELEIDERNIGGIFSDRNRLFLAYRRINQEGILVSDIYLGGLQNDSVVMIRETPEVSLAGSILKVDMDEQFAYIASDRGFSIFNIDDSKNTTIGFFDNMRVNYVVKGSDGGVWLATAKNGLFRYDVMTRQIEQFTHDPNKDHTLLGNNIYSLYEDFSGMLLIGYGGEGLSSINLFEKPFQTFRFDPQNPHSIADNSIMSYEQINNDLYIGTRNKGLQRMHIDNSSGEIRFESIAVPAAITTGVASEVIWDIAKETDEVFWIAAAYGLVKAEMIAGHWRFSKILGGPAFRKVFIDPEGNIWAGSYRGLYLITNSNRESEEALLFRSDPEKPEGLTDDVITAFLLDRNKHFWVGTEDGGVVRLSGDYNAIMRKGDKLSTNDFEFEKVSISKQKIGGSEINGIFEQSDGSIWFATKGQGIQLWKPDLNESQTINKESGLDASNVFGIVPDDLGNLWMSTNKGIARYDAVNNDFKFYRPSDGIQGNVFMVNSYYSDQEGYIYFGGRNGFTRFKPERINDNNVLPRIHLKGMAFADKQVGIGDTLHRKVIMPGSLHTLDEIQIPYKDRNFNIFYSVIHMLYPEENQLEYYLEGFNNIPSILEAGYDRLTFTNVDVGNYELKVRAANSDDVWTDYESILKIVILPPWYKTNLAVIVFLLFVIMIVVFLVRLLLNRQALQHELRIEKLEKTSLTELNEAKLRFFTNVSHEFRTPLSLTLGPIDNLLKDERVNDVKVIRQLKLARRNARVLLNLVDQIIDFRRLDAGRVKLDAGEYDISSLMESVIKNFEVLISKKDVEVFVNYPDDPLMMWFDHAKIERVFYNLLSNAMKYVTKEGSIAVSVSRVNNIPNHPELDGKWACVSIYNDGEQIPEDSLPKVFERFYKVDNAQLGSGIGLAYSKSLLDLHKGMITVENTTDSGVTFNLYLRRGKEYLAEDELLEKAFVPEVKETPYVDPVNDHERIIIEAESDMSILIVEDNEELREFFHGALSKKFKYHEAENGLVGLEKAQAEVPDIIITDLLMPEMNGIQLIEALKEKDETSHIPIILLTAVSTPEEKVIAYNAGADAYVVKPFEINVLEAQLARLIENRKKVQQQILSGEEEDKEVGMSVRREEHFIKKVNELIEEFIEDPELNVNGLAEKISLSSTQLYRKVKALTGLSTVDYIKEHRLDRAAELLKTTPSSVKEVCYETGFKSPSYFVKCFKKKYGMTPREFAG